MAVAAETVLIAFYCGVLLLTRCIIHELNHEEIIFLKMSL